MMVSDDDGDDDAEFECELEEDLQSDTSGYFRRLMVSLCVGGRESDEWEWGDEDKAMEDAQKFLDVSPRGLTFTWWGCCGLRL